MGGSLQQSNPTMLSAFHTALVHQLLLLGLVAVVAAVAWNVLRTLQYRRAVAGGGAPPAPAPMAVSDPEPLGRRILRVGFGLLWVVDGLLQLQSGMVLGMPTTVLRPAATGSPAWVHHLVGTGATIWSNHPIQAAASAVWIQLGIGVMLLVAPRGRWSRAAGLISVGWALVVWVFGEAFGAIFAPGLTWAFGAPGAALFYAVAGGLVALPDRAWRGPRLGRVVCAVMGAFFLGMAVLQAWPGRGFWQGRSAHGTPKGLAAMVATMATTRQPHFLSSWLTSFASFDEAHGWGVNLILVLALAGIGIGLCTGRRRAVLAATVGASVLCLATWILVEDLGVFGGVGTDPNSMIPMLLVVVAAVAALLRQPAEAVAPERAAPAPLSVADAGGPTGAEAPVAVAAATDGVPSGSTSGNWWEGLSPGYAGRLLAALAALVVVLVGAIPMAAASTNPNADPIISEAINGTPNLINAPAPGFTLTDQYGRPMSLSSLRGKAVALTFLDPVCSSDCPLIAQEFRQADSMLGAQSRGAVFVAVVANPVYRSLAAVRAFNEQEGLTHVANWLYLTGPVDQLRSVWNRYGVEVDVTPAGSMVAHSDLAYVIGPDGRERSVLSADPGTDPSAHSSFSVELDDQLRSMLPS
ncbi:MAG TPA: SCO family protein [Acidimicrobiales bacterium]|nr:SCO family protein [Acidimicrobiales bacterium]